jgi:nicotinate-nucleotide adenylyltransferase
VKLAILGGSYNPVHLGHLSLAEAVLSAFDYDRIVLVPAFQSPFKPGAQPVSAADRLDMLAASIPADPRLTVDDCEIRRAGVSYTVDTIADIEKRYGPTGKPGLILGDDLARGFPRWRKAGDIAAAADIIIAHRRSSEPVSFPYPFRQLDNDILDISSGMVRERIKEGKNWRYLVPQGARFIIEDRRLYGYAPLRTGGPVPDPGADLPFLSGIAIARLEEMVRAMVNPPRFLHSRNTALLSHDLCIRFGLDPRAGYLAGITHDMCKSMGEEELRSLAGKDRGGISKLEQKKPSLLHARAAATILRDRFGVWNEDILEAVRFHTIGSTSMGPLAKVVFIADKIEPSRESVSRNLRELTGFPDLDSLFTAVLDETVAFLRSRETELSEGTLRLLDLMHKRRPL